MRIPTQCKRKSTFRMQEIAESRAFLIDALSVTEVGTFFTRELVISWLPATSCGVTKAHHANSSASRTLNVLSWPRPGLTIVSQLALSSKVEGNHRLRHAGMTTSDHRFISCSRPQGMNLSASVVLQHRRSPHQIHVFLFTAFSHGTKPTGTPENFHQDAIHACSPTGK